VTSAALVLVVLLAAPDAAPPPAAQFDEANAAYRARDFEGAARGYEAVLAGGWESPALHVNLGNARLRLGRRGAAIASYTRALRLDPGDADARANLELARAGIVDVLEREARPLILRALDRAPGTLALGLFAVGWLGLWTGLAVRRLAAPRARASGVAGAAAFAAALLAAGGGALLAGKAAARSTPVAVVITQAAPVREGPEPALRPSFDLHEGTEVRILEVRGDTVRVRLGGGAEGWMAARDLEGV
jgi:tetratricopeptide (TPR) repeat protein